MGSYEKCCDKKKVGKISYTLAWTGGEVPANCLNSCVYTQDDDPSKMFCFASGYEIVTCRKGMLYSFIPCVFIIILKYGNYLYTKGFPKVD